MRQRRLLLTGTALLLSILTYLCTTALIQPPTASAHAYVIGSDPVDGSTVAKMPKAVHISFNAAIGPLSSAHVYFIQGGNLIDAGAAPSQVVLSNTRELIIPLKDPSAQPGGSYEVIWTAVANGDGHTTYGIIGFNVGFSGLIGIGFTGNPILGPSTSNDQEGIQTLDSTGLLAVLWEWLACVALTIWISILIMEQFVLRDNGHGAEFLAQGRKRSSSLQDLCLVTLLLVGSTELFLRIMRIIQVKHSSDFPLALVFSLVTKTNYGHIWLLRMVLVALIMGLLHWTRRSTKRRPISELAQSLARSDPQRPLPIQEAETVDTNQTDDTGRTEKPFRAMPALSLASQRVVWLLLAGLLSFLFVLTNPAAQVLQPHLSAIIFDWLKSLAQDIWFGGFVYLAYVLLPVLRTKNKNFDAKTLVTLLQRLTPVLLASIGIQLVSLLFLSNTSIHDPQQLLTDPYGRTLAVQLMIIAMIVLLSTYILFVLRPRLIRQTQLLPTVEAELADRYARQSALRTMGWRLMITTNILSVLAAGALLCSTLMAFFAPPIVFPEVTYTNQSALPADAVSTQTKQIGTFSVTLELLPGRSSEANTVIMLINGRDRKPVTDAQVQLSATMQIMDMGTGYALITGGNPVYATTFDRRKAFNMAGPWVITVEIERPNQQAVRGTFQVVLS